ncbi:MAG: hypothetical protein AAF602_11485, partial [Myxococcota bacterium]
MREFHYVRTVGEQGGVDACPGQAVGVDLATLLEDGLPPWRVALELIAGLCEILDIADEDEEVHGSIELRQIFLDDDGSLSLEGFGLATDPEADRAGDRYGLGYVAYRLLSDHPLPWPLPIETPETHDEAVLDAVLDIELDGLPEAMQDDVQWYVAKLLAHDPAVRPSALDAWRTFIAFAATVEGPTLDVWAAEAIQGGGSRRGSESLAVEDEALSEATRTEGPLSRELPDDPEASEDRDAQVTAFWTRRSTPRPGGGGATDFWNPEELAAMESGTDAAPRPRRAPGEGERRSRSAVFRRRLATRTGGAPEPEAV